MKVTKVAGDRKAPWKVDGYFGGRRVRRFFRTEREARAEAALLSGERAEAGPAGDRLSPGERIELAALRDRVAEAGGSMAEAVAFWLRHAAPPARPMRMDELLEDAIATKGREGKSDRYLTQLRSAVGQLCRWEGIGGTWAHELTTERIRAWAEGNGWAGKTRRNYLIDVRTVFEHGKRIGAVRSNATDGIPLPADSGADEVPVLSPREAMRLVVAAGGRGRGRGTRGEGSREEGTRGEGSRVEGGFVSRWEAGREERMALLPYVVLGLFAGLRPERELGLLWWDRVDLEEGVVIVDGRTAKSRARRVVDLAPNAVALLKRCEGREGPVCPRNLRKRFEALRRAAGLLEGWRGDVMRHSFASYVYARDQDEARLKAQMGHSQDSATLWRHYRRRVSRREAERFWGIGLEMRGA
jgi:integrase